MDVETIFSASFAVLFVHFLESACITQGVCSIPRLTYVSVIFLKFLIYISYHFGFYKFVYVLQRIDSSVVMWDSQIGW